MRVACLIAVLCFAAAQASLQEDWQAFKAEYGKSYSDAEDAFRMKVFADNQFKIEKHNELHAQGLSGFTMGMNRFGDMLNSEFVAMMNGVKGASEQKGEIYQPTGGVTKDEVDWRTKGAVTPVKDQGQCGSCWSFSATGSLEGQHYLNAGKLTSLSEQNLVDCSFAEGNLGCAGGLMESAFTYIQKNDGIDTEVSYPYKARDGRCAFDPANVGATDTGYKNIRKGSESDLQDAVTNVGPISVSMDASHTSFQMYKSGIYDEPRCSSTNLDHGVLAVGYGTEGTENYWIVKNSWGTSWGMEGYFNMAKDKNNMCGVATDASYPTV